MSNVVAFRGTHLVAVRAEPGRYSIMLAKIGEPAAQFQTSHPTLAEAEYDAREGAALCGWRYVGVFDAERIAHIQKWSGDGLARRQAEADGAGPDAA